MNIYGESADCNDFKAKEKRGGFTAGSSGNKTCDKLEKKSNKVKPLDF